jgi:hypothetical protein
MGLLSISTRTLKMISLDYSKFQRVIRCLKLLKKVIDNC